MNRVGAGAVVLVLPLLMMDVIPASATPPGPNGKLVFNCPATPDPNGGVTEAICVMNPDGTGYTRIVDSIGINVQATWSPDGTKIAFVSSRNSSPPFLGAFGGDIWVMNADGSDPTQLTHSSTEAAPAWSPDGRIAFTSFRDHLDDHSYKSSIYVMNADGSNQHAVTTVGTDTFDDQPAWSPDGKRIAFVRYGFGGAGIDGGYQEIYTVNDDGTNFQQLTIVPDFIATFGVSKDHPTWSPDGKQVAFTEAPWLTDLAGYVIGVVNADGSNERILTTNSDTLPNGPNLEMLDVAWAPDGTALVAVCSFVGRPDLLGGHLCLVDPSNGAISAPLPTPGFGVEVDWGRAPAAANPNIVDCNDPRLAQSIVPGAIQIVNQPGCSSIDLGGVTQVAGSVDIVNTGVQTIDLGALAGAAGSVDISDNGNVQTISLGAGLTTGSVTITDNNNVTNVDLGTIGQVTGSVTITDNANAANVSLDSVGHVTGSVNISDNSYATVVSLGSGGTVTGNVTIESAGDVVNLASTQAAGNVTITANGSNSVSALTGGATTDVSILGGIAAMRVVIPSGAFVQPVPFTIGRLVDPASETGVDPSGSAALIQPIGGYVFSFAVPTLNADAQLAFRIDLSQLDPDTRAAVLAGVGDGSATIATKGDVAGAQYQSFATCGGQQTPQTDACVTVTLIGADGNEVDDPTLAAFVNLAGVAGHFSTWAVVLVEPLPDTTAPALAPAVTPNPVLLHGAATASANASDSGSGVATSSCGAVDTSSVGSHSVNCTATDNAGNTATATANYQVVYSTDACLGEPGHQVLAPLAADGSTVLREDRAIPVKFRVCDANGRSIGTPGVVSSFRLVQIVTRDGSHDVNLAPLSRGHASTFRWDPAAQQWIFNLSTDGLREGAAYVYDIRLADGSDITFRFTLRGDRDRDDHR